MFKILYLVKNAEKEISFSVESRKVESYDLTAQGFWVITFLYGSIFIFRKGPSLGEWIKCHIFLPSFEIVCIVELRNPL